jgi:hypothetical protein
LGVLGIPFQIEYDGKNYQTGLMGVHLYIRRPDGMNLGPFAMTEDPGLFAGSYFYSYQSSVDDEPGEYKVRIVSPQEGITASLAMPLYPATGGEGGSSTLLVLGNRVAGYVKNDQLSGRVENEPVSGGVINDDVQGSVELNPVAGEAIGSDLGGSIESNQILGEVHDEQLP